MSLWKKIHVTEGTKALDVFVPDNVDRIEAKDLQDYAIGKTKEDFKNKEIFNRKKNTIDKKEAAVILNDYKRFNDRRKSGSKKYF